MERQIKTAVENQQLFDDNSHLSLNRRSSEQLANCEQTNNFVQSNNIEEEKEIKPIAIVGGIGRCKTNDSLNEQLFVSSSFVRAITIPNSQNTEWTDLREFRVKEMNEIRQRAAHMENTMRWWLLSAEQWRQKWLSVRNERNKLKEENIHLKKELIEIKNKIKEISIKNN
ncbi:hypothetical protein ACQ4LE_003994 [Meloidogyne hapla]|uniref:Uncharacterized protein n=1 Tax=Meloidogyne hapla TaxID=6305 RepID=A0A1I8B086_MELHA